MDGMLRAMPYAPARGSGPKSWWRRLKSWARRTFGRHPVARHRKTSLMEWQAYYHLDPFGGERGDLQAAMVKQAVLNTMGRGEDDDPFTLDDCMPRFGESERERKRREQSKQEDLNRKIKDVLGRF